MAILEIRDAQVRKLATARPSWRCAVVGARTEPVARELRKLRLDQAPVIDSRDRAVGIVWTSVLEELLTAGEDTLREEGEWIRPARWELRDELDKLLASLAEHRAVLVAEPDQDPFGLLSISDLSWPEFRAVLYPLFCSLEHHLARLIGNRFDDEWEWINGLPPHSRPGIVGNWKLAERSNVETKATVGASLRDLLSVALKDKDLRAEISSEPSKGKSEERFKAIADFRNLVAHPTRPLVLNQKDVEDLRRVLADAADLEARVRRAAEKSSAK